MARGLGLTALRVALGGLSGVGQDRAAMREAQRVEQEQARALERQRAMDELSMLNQGFMRAEDVAGERGQTGAALSRALSSAAAMMRPGGMAGGAAPSLQTGDLRRVAEAPGMEAPQQRVTLGGTTFQRESPTSAALRRAEQEFGRERMAKEQQAAEASKAQEANVTAAMRAYNLTREQAQEYVRTGKSPLVEAQRPMTAAEKDAAARGWAEINLRREAAKTAGAGGGRRAGATDKTSLATTLPSVIEASTRLSQMKEADAVKLRPRAMDWASSSMNEPGGIGVIFRTGTQMMLQPTSQEMAYIQTANAVADAVARATDVGVLANFDIIRFRSQVTPTALDADNPDAMKFKFRTLQGWANWLARNKDVLQAADAAYEAGKPLPDAQLRWKGEPPPETGVQVAAGSPERRGAGQAPSAQPATQDAELERARAAIARGKDRQAVIQLYESTTGRKWPGG